jgi:hypothetical protein
MNTQTLMACTDCLMFIANGDEPEDNGNQWSADNIARHWPPYQYNLCCGDSDNDDDFSWQPCECCGSRLGGSRHEIVAIETKTP